MSNRILIDAVHPEEVRVVLADGERLEEFDFESTSKQQIKGNIYLGKVTRVEPSLQAAFVEYGGNKQGFLPFTEIHFSYFQIPVADKEAIEAALEQEEAERNARIEAQEKEREERVLNAEKSKKEAEEKRLNAKANTDANANVNSAEKSDEKSEKKSDEKENVVVAEKVETVAPAETEAKNDDDDAPKTVAMAIDDTVAETEVEGNADKEKAKPAPRKRAPRQKPAAKAEGDNSK